MSDFTKKPNDPSALPPAEPDKAGAPAEGGRPQTKPRIDSLDKLIKIAGLAEAEGETDELLGRLEEPEVKPRVKLPDIPKPAWLEEMEAAESAGQADGEPPKEGRKLDLGAKLAAAREKAGALWSKIKRRDKPAGGAAGAAKPARRPVSGGAAPAAARRVTEAVSEEIVFHEVDGAMAVKPRATRRKGLGWRRLGLGLAAVLGLGVCLWLAVGWLDSGLPVMYDISYASGYSRDPYCRDEQSPVQSDDLPTADLQSAKLRVQGAETGLQLLDADGELLYQFAAAGFDTLRGELARDFAGAEQAVWLCAERWQKSRYNGYIDGKLLGSRLLLVDVADGGQLFAGDSAENELFLTACGTYCYFYAPGQPERHKWLIFGKQEAEPARIVCRSTDNWAVADTVYAFGYAGAPYVMLESEGEEAGKRLDIDRICFYVGAEGLRVELKHYEQTDVERDRWDYVAKEIVEIPYLTEDDAQ